MGNEGRLFGLTVFFIFIPYVIASVSSLPILFIAYEQYLNNPYNIDYV